MVCRILNDDREAELEAAADAGGSCSWDDGSCSSSSSVPATPTPGPPRVLAGRRALTAGSRSSKGSSALDVERYLYCLESHKRAVGGVLASSSTEPASWDAAELSGPGPSAQQANGSLFSSSKSTSRKAVAFAASERPDALAAVAMGDAPGVAQPLQRRSQSAHSWLPPATPSCV